MTRAHACACVCWLAPRAAYNFTSTTPTVSTCGLRTRRLRLCQQGPGEGADDAMWRYLLSSCACEAPQERELMTRRVRDAM
eukprot:jgi/Mesen1/7425/ME000388S06656